MELVITGFAGESGCRKIYQNEEMREKLLGRYPKSFFRVWEKEEEERVSFENCKGITDYALCAPDGVYGALWRLLKKNCLGASYSERLIPVTQQTIEVCEFFSLNPFRVEAENTGLFLCEDAGPLKARFPEAVTIGYTEKGPAIRRTDGENVSYLRKSE